MAITAGQVRELRERTGLGIMECKSALAESNGDVDGAITILRKKGMAASAKKAGRETREGRVGSYIHHNGTLGVLVEVNCETDFVARNPDFQTLVSDLAMHIAASDPRFVQRDDVTEDVLTREREIYKEQARATGKPEAVLEKIVEGRMAKFYSETVLYEQPFVRDPNITVKDYIASYVQKTGENIRVRRFARFKLGE